MIGFIKQGFPTSDLQANIVFSFFIFVILLRSSIHLMCVMLIVGNVSLLKSHLKMPLAEVE